MSPLIQRHATAIVGMIAVLLMPVAHADLNIDLNALSAQASALNAQLTGTQISPDNICAPLGAVAVSAHALAQSATRLDANLAAPLQVDATTMDAIDGLLQTTAGLANQALRLSTDLQGLNTTANALNIKDGIVSMLQLSTDIGTMADRIGEMADKILVMSDNIGTMADRILATEQLQNQNVALTTQTILQTQTNALSLVQVVEDSSYQLSIENLTAAGYSLASQMASVTLSPWTMKTQLATVATNVHSYVETVKAARATISSDAAKNTMYTTAGTLYDLGNLALMLKSLGDAVNGYVIAINGMQAMTSGATLQPSLTSMLQLSADIGVGANAILEMADQILVMSDNIGMEADQILSTQQVMNGDVAYVQAAILSAQGMAVNLFKSRSL